MIEFMMMYFGMKLIFFGVGLSILIMSLIALILLKQF